MGNYTRAENVGTAIGGTVSTVATALILFPQAALAVTGHGIAGAVLMAVAPWITYAAIGLIILGGWSVVFAAVMAVGKRTNSNVLGGVAGVGTYFALKALFSFSPFPWPVMGAIGGRTAGRIVSSVRSLLAPKP